ncbi:tripartite tricarboxylate transporter TctB family protein [Ramlibacter sp.]|uniref:tripartite tricarboxylate transporter TctB family protein n=1 Tax=Ramlibacter sp. TaxID=1917967 RepID=UPI003D0A12DA
MDNMETAEARNGVPTYIVEAVVALLVIGLGLLVIAGTRKLGTGWTSDGPGAGYFPFYIGIILCVSGAGTLYQAVLGKKRNTEVFVDNASLRRVLVVLLPAVVYVGLIQFIGIYVASAIYMAVFMTWLGKINPAKSIAGGVAIAAVFFLMFEVWFKVPLAKGVFHPLSFLGY